MLTGDRAAVAGLLLIAVIVLGAVAAPILARGDPNAVDVLNRLGGPSLGHPLGTDYLGRDELARLLFGARLSLVLVVIASLATSCIGLTLGILAGYAGGAADQVIMRIVDALQALPGLLLALAIAGLLGPGIVNLMLAIVLAWWTGYARLVRGLTLTVRERPFVEASRALGAAPGWVLLRHVLPNLLGPAVVLTTLDMGSMLLAIAGLSFLGLGTPPPTPEWGSMLAEARTYFDQAAQLVLLPGLAVSLLALAFNLVGDGLRDLLDPRFRANASI